MSRNIKIKYTDNTEEIREVSDAEYNDYLYRLHLDMEIHNRDFPSNQMKIENENETEMNTESILDDTDNRKSNSNK